MVFSPRTTLAKEREQDQMVTNSLIKHFDPFTINFLKRDFELNHGRINKIQVHYSLILINY